MSESPKGAHAVGLATASTGAATVLELIPTLLGVVASIIGIVFTLTLIVTTIRRDRRESQEHQLKVTALEDEIKRNLGRRQESR